MSMLYSAIDLAVCYSDLENRYVYAKPDTGNPIIDNLASNLIRDLPATLAEEAVVYCLGPVRAVFFTGKYGIKFTNEFYDNFRYQNKPFGEALFAAAKKVGFDVGIDFGVPAAVKAIGVNDPIKKSLINIGTTATINANRMTH